MKDEEKKRFGPLTNKLKLGIGRKSEGMTDFGEERVLWLREKREISKCLSESEIELTLEYI